MTYLAACDNNLLLIVHNIGYILLYLNYANEWLIICNLPCMGARRPAGTHAAVNIFVHNNVFNTYAASRVPSIIARFNPGLSAAVHIYNV